MLVLEPFLSRALLAMVLVGCFGSATAAIELRFPAACEVGRSCEIQNYVDLDPSPAARDHQCGSLTYDGHNGTDVRVPTLEAQRAGVEVLAAADGRVARARDGLPDVSVRGLGKEAVRGRECGNGLVIEHGDGWETQYCHLAEDSLSVRPGEQVRAGQSIGRIGVSGLTEYPHLHFTVRRDGKVVDPFAVDAPEGACGGGASLWRAADRDKLAYKARAVLNAGFASGAVTMEAIEAGAATKDAPSRTAPALVAFVRLIGGRSGDVQKLSIVGPDGRIMAESTAEPLDRPKAQVMMFAGRKTPPGGWRAGRYEATYSVVSNGEVVIERTFRIEI